MINDKLKEKIRPNLKMHLPEDRWDMMDLMFNECYLLHTEGKDLVAVDPLEGEVCMMFFEINGAYNGIGYWGYVKENGVKL